MWAAVGSDCGPTTVPSPKLKRYDAIDPSESEEPTALATTGSGASPVEGVTISCATGGRFTFDTVTTTEAEPVAPPLSVTVTVQVQRPAA